MNIISATTYEDMSQQGAKLLIDTIKHKKDAIICLATGSSPKRMYEIFVEEVNKEQIDLSEVTFLKLDEWCDIQKEDTCSCAYFLQKNLFDKLAMPFKNYIQFDPEAEDLTQELAKVDTFLETHPIDLMILGLGMNGHLGLNEPANELTLPCHLTKLNETTKTHDMTKGFTLTRGMTIGMKGIFDSKQILMLVCGERKEAAYDAFLSRKITTQTPSSFLWLHPNCVTIIDKSQF